MKRKLLLNSATFTERNFWGNVSSITFHPVYRPGWYFRTKSGDVPINYKIARVKSGYIQLYVDSDLANVYEHISPLRSLGYDGIALEFHDKWPPYVGGVGAYLLFFKNELRFKSTDDEIPYMGPSQRSKAIKRGNTCSFIEIIPVSDKMLHMDVASKWKPLPEYHRKFVFETLHPEDQQRIWDARPQGYPHYRRTCGQLLRMFGWPNMRHISWKDDGTPHQVAEEWWYHAVQDTIGALNLCDHIALPAAFVKRVCGGHSLDLEAVKKAFQ